MSNTNYPGYENTGLTVDLVIFTVDQDRLQALLVKRASEPFAGRWSIPGGFLKVGETLEQAAERVMEEKTGVREVYLEQLYTFGSLGRDPRGRIITVVYFALIPWKQLTRPGSTRVEEAGWFAVDKVPELAFDHNEILEAAVSRLKAKTGYSSIVYGLLPEAFRLSALQKIYEVILDDKTFDKRNFRKKMLASGLLEETGHREIAGAHRPAMLYKFKQKELVFLD
jgi:8-oxo-dGTP diphosphatase